MLFMFFLFVLCSKYKLPRMLFRVAALLYLVANTSCRVCFLCFFVCVLVANTSCRVCFLCFFVCVLVANTSCRVCFSGLPHTLFSSKCKLPRMLFMFFCMRFSSKYKLPRMLFRGFFFRCYHQIFPWLPKNFFPWLPYFFFPRLPPGLIPSWERTYPPKMAL